MSNIEDFDWITRTCWLVSIFLYIHVYSFFFVYFCANVFNYYNFLSSFFNRLYSEESMDLWTLTATGMNTRMNLDMRIMNIGWGNLSCAKFWESGDIHWLSICCFKGFF